MLRTSACGFGSLAFAGLCQQAAASTGPATLLQRQPMFAPRAKRVIFIFMAGGPSHVDSYDYKPELIRNHDKITTSLAFDLVRLVRRANGS